LVSIFLIAFLVSLILPILYLYSFYYLLVTEIVPQDQKHIPKPKVGDKISVYGVWVQDNELTMIIIPKPIVVISSAFSVFRV
jgi:hypothetical protein